MSGPVRRSRTRIVLMRAAIVLLATYGVLALATGHPIRTLVMEVVCVVLLWSLYVVRFMSDNPHALGPEVLWFRLMDRLHPPAAGTTVFTGSSTMGHWMMLAEDMAPLPVVNRGINGAQLNQIAYHAGHLVLPHKPVCVVLYAGENDLSGFLGLRRKTAEEVLASFRGFCTKVHAQIPTVPICFIAMKTRLSPDAPSFSAANRIIQAECESDPRLHFIDIVPALLSPDGKPRADTFDVDGVHLNSEGYRILASVVKPRMMEIVGGLAESASSRKLVGRNQNG